MFKCTNTADNIKYQFIFQSGVVITADVSQWVAKITSVNVRRISSMKKLSAPAFRFILSVSTSLLYTVLF